MKKHAVLICLCIWGVSMAQQGRFKIVINDRRADNFNGAYTAFLEANKTLVKFSDGNYVFPPKGLNPDSINSIYVVIHKDTLNFLNNENMLKYSGFPASTVKAWMPDYRRLFMDKQDLVLNIDQFPFESPENAMTAEESAKSMQMPANDLTVYTLHYGSYNSTEVKKDIQVNYASLIDSIGVADTLKLRIYLSDCDRWGYWESIRYYQKDSKLYCSYEREPKECLPKNDVVPAFLKVIEMTPAKKQKARELSGFLQAGAKHPDPVGNGKYKHDPANGNTYKITFKRLSISTNNVFGNAPAYDALRKDLIK